jgi:hypothetical protein
MSVKPFIGMLKNLFSKLKRQVTSADTNTPEEYEEKSEKKEK